MRSAETEARPRRRMAERLAADFEDAFQFAWRLCDLAPRGRLRSNSSDDAARFPLSPAHCGERNVPSALAEDGRTPDARPESAFWPYFHRRVGNLFWRRSAALAGIRRDTDCQRQVGDPRLWIGETV